MDTPYTMDMLLRLIEGDLEKLEKSDLIEMDQDLYNRFKSGYEKLKSRIYNEKEIAQLKGLTTESNTWYSFKLEFSKVSSEFDFYMSDTGGRGYQKIIRFKLEKIKTRLQKILNELTDFNYRELDQKFKEEIKYFKETNLAFLDFPEIKEIINMFDYKVFKYKLKEGIISQDFRFEAFLPFLKNDAICILKNKDVDVSIKEKIELYLLDSHLLEKNLEEFCFLIHLGENNFSSRSKKNKILYHEEDLTSSLESMDLKTIEQAFTEISIYMVSGRRESIFLIINHFFENANVLYSDKKDEEIRNLISKYGINAFMAALLKWCMNSRDMGDFFNQVLQKCLAYDFKGFKYVFEYLFRTCSEYQLNDLLNLRKEMPQFTYIMDCSFIAQMEKLYFKIIQDYAMKTDNDVVFNYIFKKYGHYYSDELRTYVEKNENLFSTYLNIITKQSPEKIVEYFFLLLKMDSKMKLLESISDESLKKRVFDKIYGKIDTGFKNQSLYEFTLIFDDSIKQKYEDYCSLSKTMIHPNFKISREKIEKLNPFEAYFVSKLPINNLAYFVSLYYEERLDWDSLLRNASEMEIEEVLKYFYLGNKDEFIKKLNEKKIDLSQEFILELLDREPEQIENFYSFLSLESIAKLNARALDIFCASYEEQISTTLKDHLDQVFSKNEEKEREKLFTYVMHRGIINSEILYYVEEYNHPVIKRAIKNCKDPFLRVSLITNMIWKSELDEEYYHMLVFSDSEFMSIKSTDEKEEVSELKFRKYYANLMRVIDIVPENIRFKIIRLLAKSHIKTYILTLAKKYPDFIDLLLENVEDFTIYQEILEISEEMVAKI